VSISTTFAAVESVFSSVAVLPFPPLELASLSAFCSAETGMGLVSGAVAISATAAAVASTISPISFFPSLSEANLCASRGASFSGAIAASEMKSAPSILAAEIPSSAGPPVDTSWSP